MQPSSRKQATPLATDIESKRQLVSHELSRLASAQDKFVVTAADEIRLPLARLQGYTAILAQLVQKGSAGAGRGRAIVERIALGTRQLCQAVQSALDGAAVEANAMALQIKPMALSEPIADALKELDNLVGQRVLRVEVEGLAELPRIQGDVAQLRKAWCDIIGHAIVYTASGGQIRIVGQVLDIQQEALRPSQRKPAFAQVCVIGSPFAGSNEVAKGQDDAHRLDRGLAIARGIIESHDARLWIGNGQEKGGGEQIRLHVIFPVPQSR